MKSLKPIPTHRTCKDCHKTFKMSNFNARVYTSTKGRGTTTYYETYCKSCKSKRNYKCRTRNQEVIDRDRAAIKLREYLKYKNLTNGKHDS